MIRTHVRFISLARLTVVVIFGALAAAAWSAFSVSSGSSTVLRNVWTHLAVSWGSAGAKLFINGVQVGSDANTRMPAAGFGGSVIARLGTGDGFTTAIDELRISNVQRTTFNELAP